MIKRLYQIIIGLFKLLFVFLMTCTVIFFACTVFVSLSVRNFFYRKLKHYRGDDRKKLL